MLSPGVRRLEWLDFRGRPWNLSWWWMQSGANPSLSPLSQFQGNFQRILALYPLAQPRTSLELQACPDHDQPRSLRLTGKALWKEWGLLKHLPMKSGVPLIGVPRWFRLQLIRLARGVGLASLFKLVFGILHCLKEGRLLRVDIPPILGLLLP